MIASLLPSPISTLIQPSFGPWPLISLGREKAFFSLNEWPSFSRIVLENVTPQFYQFLHVLGVVRLQLDSPKITSEIREGHESCNQTSGIIKEHRQYRSLMFLATTINITSHLQLSFVPQQRAYKFIATKQENKHTYKAKQCLFI